MFLAKQLNCQVLVKVIKPYTRLKIEFVANVLGVSNEEVCKSYFCKIYSS